MKRFYAETFSQLAALFQAWQSHVGLGKEAAQVPVNPKIVPILEATAEILKRSELPMSASLIEEKLAMLRLPTPLTAGGFGAMMPEVRSSLEREMAVRLFMLIPPTDAQYYDQPSLFGQPVNDAYPSAIGDIVEAGNCLATGRSTACVFHLMRVVEKGVRALTTKLGVTLADDWDWNGMLEQAKKQLGILAPPQKERDAYWNLIQTLYAIKNGARNPTIHVRRDYTPEQAETLLRFVKQLMNELVEASIGEVAP